MYDVCVCVCARARREGPAGGAGLRSLGHTSAAAGGGESGHPPKHFPLISLLCCLKSLAHDTSLGLGIGLGSFLRLNIRGRGGIGPSDVGHRSCEVVDTRPVSGLPISICLTAAKFYCLVTAATA